MTSSGPCGPGAPCSPWKMELVGEDLFWGCKLDATRHRHTPRSKHTTHACAFTQTHNVKPQCTVVKGQKGFLHRRLYCLPVILQGRPTHQ